MIYILLCSLLVPCALGAPQQQTIFQCDRGFDEREPRGEFSFPLLPKQPTTADAAATQDWHNETRGRNLQCLYTFVARQNQRVKLEFEYFQLAGGSESCEIEYVDIYSELKSVEDDLLSASLGGRYCGSVAPQIRISLHNVIILVFHSRGTDARITRKFGFRGKYSFIPDTKFIPGTQFGQLPCSYVIEPSKKKKGLIHSPTYPGTYPQNFHCSYLLRGRSGQRIRLLFRDFDIFFGGEHCPYDALTVFDGRTQTSPIIKKVCGLQQRMEMYSVGPDLLIHFNTSNPTKADPRGFVIEYEFSSRYVDISGLLSDEPGVTHMRGTECDVRVESNKETTHNIHSPNYPDMYPANTTCSYIIDGLQGDQNLERVIVTFYSLSMISDDEGFVTTTNSPNDINNGDDVTCPHAWVGIASSEGNMKAALSATDDSSFDTTLCDRVPQESALLGPYISEGPRMVIQFGTTDRITTDNISPLGFKARVDFKTDFGIAGEAMGTSNECLFRFRSPMGFFNSPRYPANYPLDTNCTYFIEGRKGQQILIHFEQFALFGDKDDKCNDWLEIYDVFRDENETGERLKLQEKYCAQTFPGPTVSSFGAHAMRVVFSSDSEGTGNGFKALYEIRRAPKVDIPSGESKEVGNRDSSCGKRIYASDDHTTGHVISPNFPIKYNKDVHCNWEVVARKGYKILLTMQKMEVEGEMTASSASCQKAVIRVSDASKPEYCGTDKTSFIPMVTKNNTVRISFLTSPDKVNGLQGFDMIWTEVREVNDMSQCNSAEEYMCTYSKLCISSKLRCNGEHNCGKQDDTDESHCELKENSTDKTIIVAGVFCGTMMLFIAGFFCYLFKSKLEKKKKQRQHSSRHRQRQPYRSHKPKTNTLHSDTPELPQPATSRFVHHDATGMLPPIALIPYQQKSTNLNHANEHTFFG